MRSVVGALWAGGGALAFDVAVGGRDGGCKGRDEEGDDNDVGGGGDMHGEG